MHYVSETILIYMQSKSTKFMKKYTEADGQICLTVECVASEISLSVRDTGLGIPQDMLPKVFDLFPQIDRTLGRSKMSRRIFVEAVGMVWKLRADALRGKL